MESSTINRGGLLGGIGLFLFGMSLFEHTIQESGKGRLKHTLKKYTNTLPKSIITGMLQTFVFQSSTIVTMITLGFVGAGLIGLYNALGVVLGANIGTSLTTRIVAILGFNFKIETYILPLIGVSGLAMIMTNTNHRVHKTAKIVTGFGLLFLGLGYMKESVDSMTNTVNFAHYADRPLWGFMLMGAILTTIIQTSSGTTIITLTALSGGLITLDMGLGIIVGANIGSALSTGIMGFISSSAGQHTKKQVAISQIVFNIMTAIIVIPYIYALKNVILSIAPYIVPVDIEHPHYQSSLNETALAMFHTCFNVILVCIWSPVLKTYSLFVSKLFIAHNHDQKLNVELLNTSMPEELLNALYHDTRHLIILIKEYYSTILGDTGPVHSNDMINHYTTIKAIQATLLSTINHHKTLINDSHILSIIEQITNVILDACAGSASLRETLDHCENIAQEQDINGLQYYNTRRQCLQQLIIQIDEIPHHIKAGTAQEYSSLLNKSLMQHRQQFMELVQQENSKEDELISELIKTDHYITNSCQELIRAIILWRSIRYKVLEL